MCHFGALGRPVRPARDSLGEFQEHSRVWNLLRAGFSSFSTPLPLEPSERPFPETGLIGRLSRHSPVRRNLVIAAFSTTLRVGTSLSQRFRRPCTSERRYRSDFNDPACRNVVIAAISTILRAGTSLPQRFRRSRAPERRYRSDFDVPARRNVVIAAISTILPAGALLSLRFRGSGGERQEPGPVLAPNRPRHGVGAAWTSNILKSPNHPQGGGPPGLRRPYR